MEQMGKKKLKQYWMIWISTGVLAHYDNTEHCGIVVNKLYLGLLVETRQVPSQHLLYPTICTLLQRSSVAGKMATDDSYDKEQRRVIILTIL